MKSAVMDYNALRDRAVTFRKELIMQREAAGLKLKNTEAVEAMHPIPQLLDKQGDPTNSPIADPSWIKAVPVASKIGKEEKAYIKEQFKGVAPTRMGLPARNVKEWLGS